MCMMVRHALVGNGRHTKLSISNQSTGYLSTCMAKSPRLLFQECLDASPFLRIIFLLLISSLPPPPTFRMDINFVYSVATILK